MSLTVWVPGTPATQGSKRGMLHRHTGRVVMLETGGRKLKAWREMVTSTVHNALIRGVGDRVEGPVALDITVYLPKPRSNKNPYPSTRNTGDIEKHARSIGDAITDAGAWRDDCQVVDAALSKRWADHRGPGALINIKPAQGDQ